MGSSHFPAAAPMAAAADVDPVTRLVLGWLAAKRSENTRTAYARDIGITPQHRASHAPSWLAWCQAQQVHPVTGVTGLEVALYARRLEVAGLSPASAARKLAAVSGWYDWLARRGHIAASPAAGLARPKTRTHAPVTPGLTRDQALALVHAADAARGPQRARTAALVAVLLFTGARVSEVIGADVEDLTIDHGRRVLWVSRRSGRRQSLALPGPAASRIDAYLAQRRDLPGGPVLPRQPGAQARRVLFATTTGGRLYAADVWRVLRHLAKQAGLPADLTCHVGPRAMRQSFAALYLDAGGSLLDLQSAMGHADPRTTRRYDRTRHTLDRPPGHVVAAYLAAPAWAVRRAHVDGRDGFAGLQTQPAGMGVQHAEGRR
jgi:integrase/recombinase XerD